MREGDLWQVSRDRAAVTVRFGRAGESAVVQTEHFPDAAAARAHVKTLGCAPSAVAPAGEDTIVLPAPWRQRHHLRRDGWFTGTPYPGARSAEFLEQHGNDARDVLGNGATAPGLTEAGLAALGDPATATPLGVAAVIAAAAATVRWNQLVPLLEEAERWASSHGPVVAAEAAVILAGLISGDPVRRRTDADEAEFTATDTTTQRVRPGWPDWQADLSTGVRARVATARDEDRAAIEAVLTPYRRVGVPLQRLMTSFLLPERQDWVDDDLDLIEADHRATWRGVPLLLSSVRTGAQLSRIAPLLHTSLVNWYGGMLPSLVEGVGTDAAPVLAAWLDERGLPVQARRRIAETLAGLPADQAMAALIDRAGDPDVLTALRAAMTRCPRRAMRLAPRSTARAMDEPVRVHVIRFPEQARAVLPDLPGPAANRVRAILAATVDAVEAPPPGALHPAAAPMVPDWADLSTLPRITLRDGSGVLPVASAGQLLAILAAAGPLDTGPLDPADLAEFGWVVFRRWVAAGMPGRDRWALTGLGRIGDDETVRRLTPMIRAWPGESGHARAVTGLDVLAAIGTDVALTHLYGISQTVKFKGLRQRAAEKVDGVAAARGLTAEQLADRLVPDLGLAADGSMRLDYGPRRFTAGFDELLRPYVTDAAGKRLKALPKPSAKDDAVLAADSYARFAALKKQVRTLAGDQLGRLERAMVGGRRWTGAEFRTFFAVHPLLRHVARRLVWAVYDGDKATGFRLAEDDSLADVHDAPISVPDDAVIGLPHPAETDLAPWGAIFDDYEIVQPFAQLGREVFTPSPADFAALRGRTAPTGRVLGLEARGWRRGRPQDDGVQRWIELPVAGGPAFVVELDPGIAVGLPAMFPEQTLTGIGSGEGLDPVTASEAMAGLVAVCA